MDVTEPRYQVGQRLHHPQFGDGLVVEVHTDRGREVLEVVFDGQLRRLSAQREWEIVDGSAPATVLPEAGPDGDGNGSDPAASAVTRSEVRAALSGLGYAADEIRHALSRLPADGAVEDQIRLALRELAGAR